MTDSADKNDFDSLCRLFEEAWKEGNPPELESYLERVQPPNRADLLAELLQVELWWRRSDSPFPTAEQYKQRFPDLVEAVDSAYRVFGERTHHHGQADDHDAFATTETPPGSYDPTPRFTPPPKSTPRKRRGIASRIGPYKILQPIGEGGMGQVFMADQEEPIKRRVALKLINTDAPSDKILARFEAERQALAMMDHQNIAKVLDAGITDDGKPYFAMELVKGVPITEYCDKNKLTPEERLGLFVQVCRAIQHAHQKGIIHRDIKPSNVLVTLYDGKPVAKVIDFGLAKALQSQLQLTERTMFTQYGQVVGTLEYMSPEQAEMNSLDVDTRTDVYSLGVMLYELLTGSTPIGRERLKSQAFDRILQLIREEEVTRPSMRLSESGDAITGISQQRKTDPRKLNLLLKGDLDWIAVKALEKDRARRYDGAAALADDVERFLNDEAISARPPSLGYRVQKGIRKHKAAVATAAVIVLLLVAGLIGTGSMWWRASKAEQAAVAGAERALRAQQKAELAREAAETSQAETEAARAAEEQAKLAAVQDRDRAQEAERKAEANAELAKAESHRALRNLYAAEMSLSQRDWENSDINNLVARLHRTKPEQMAEHDFRKFEWYYWDRLTEGINTRIEPGAESVLRLSFTADGHHLIVMAKSSVVVYDISNGQKVGALDGEYSARDYCDFDVVNRRLAIARKDQPVTLHDLLKGTRLRSLGDATNGVRAIKFRRDGQRIACGCGDAIVREYDVVSGQILSELDGPDSDIEQLSYSASGKQITAVDSDGSAYAWDLSNDTPVSRKIAGFGSSRNSFALSSDSKFLAESSSQGSITVWKLDFGEENRRQVFKQQFPLHFAEATGVQLGKLCDLNADGSLVAVSDNRTVKTWSVQTGQEYATFKREFVYRNLMALSEDGTYLAATGPGDVVRVWKFAEARHPKPLSHLHSVGDCAQGFNRNGDLLYRLENDGKLSTWNLKNEKEEHSVMLENLPALVTSNAIWPESRKIDVSRGGRYFALVTNEDQPVVSVWDTKTGRHLHSEKSEAHFIAFDEDGRHLILAAEGRFSILTTHNWKTTHEDSGIKKIDAFCPSNSYCASLNPDNSISIRSSADGQEMTRLEGHLKRVSAVVFDREGSRIVSASWDKTIRVWDVGSGRELLVLQGPDEKVLDVSLNRDGTLITAYIPNFFGAGRPEYWQWNASPNGQAAFDKRATGKH